MFAWDHSWGLDAAPLILILLNCFIRGSCIFTAIAVRANILEANATLRPRDATEVLFRVLLFIFSSDLPSVFNKLEGLFIRFIIVEIYELFIKGGFVSYLVENWVDSSFLKKMAVQ